MANNFIPFTSNEITQIMDNRNTIKQDKPNPPKGLKMKIYRFSEAWKNYND